MVRTISIHPGLRVATMGLLCGLSLSLGACSRDFALPEPLDSPVHDFVVEPSIVRPGQSLAIRFKPLVAGIPEVTVNGRATSRSSPTEHHYAYAVDGNEGEVLTVRVAFPEGESATEQAFVDAVAPNPVDPALLTLQMQPAGSVDLLGAADGAVAEDVTQVVITSDAAGLEALATVVPSGAGGFVEVSVGDNVAAELHVFAEDAVGNRSSPAVLINDIEAPPFTAIRLAPDPPRSGAILRVEIDSDPVLTTSSATLDRGSDSSEISLTLEGSAWVGELPASDYTGAATLTLRLVDPAGNAASEILDLEVAGPAFVDEARVRLRRVAPDAPAWEALGLAGAAPQGTEIELSILPIGGAWTSWGTALVQADGSFATISVGRNLLASDVVEIAARIPGTSTNLSSAFLSPDLTDPTMRSLQVTPVGGPTRPIHIEPTTSELVVAGIEVRTSIALAVRTDLDGETTTPTFVYPVDPSHPDGPLVATLTLIDRANNVGTVSIDLVVDTTGPELTFDWNEPRVPENTFPLPNFLTPPSKVTATIADAHTSVSSAAYRAHRMDLGRWWSGTAFDSLSPIDVSIPVAELPLWPFWLEDSGRPAGETLLELPDQGRLRIDFEVADTVGNVAQHSFTSSHYAIAGLSPQPHGRGWLTAAASSGSVVCAAGRSYSDASGNYDSGGGNIILIGSTDSGATWNRDISNVSVTSGNPYPGILALDETGDRGVVVGSEGLVLLIEPGCQAGARIDLGVTGQFLGAAWDGDTLWIAGDDGVYRGDSGGTIWTPVLGWPQFTGLVSLGPGRLLASTTSGAFHRSTDGGATWSAIQILSPTEDLLSLTTDDVGVAYASGHGFLLESRNGGQSWAPVPLPQAFLDYDDWVVWRVLASGTTDGLWLDIEYKVSTGPDPTEFIKWDEWWFANRIGGPWVWVGDYSAPNFWSSRSTVVMIDNYRGWTFGFDSVGGEEMVRIESTVSGGPLSWPQWP